jgi:hypothetical protein
MKTKKETRGGTRQGSGAKPKYSEPTKTKEQKPVFNKPAFSK